jgi:hypothetical protein
VRGNRLATWTVSETNLMARFPVVGHASEMIGTNDRFGYLWVSNATANGTAARPEVDGTNFWVNEFTVGMGTQKIVAAILPLFPVYPTPPPGQTHWSGRHNGVDLTMTSLTRPTKTRMECRLGW